MDKKASLILAGIIHKGGRIIKIKTEKGIASINLKNEVREVGAVNTDNLKKNLN